MYPFLLTTRTDAEFPPWLDPVGVNKTHTKFELRGTPLGFCCDRLTRRTNVWQDRRCLVARRGCCLPFRRFHYPLPSPRPRSPLPFQRFARSVPTFSPRAKSSTGSSVSRATPSRVCRTCSFLSFGSEGMRLFVGRFLFTYAVFFVGGLLRTNFFFRI